MTMKRETLVEEIWKRQSEVTGVATTARNPKHPPKEGEFPRINIFELEEPIEEGSMLRTKKARLSVLVEFFIEGTSEQAGSMELMAFAELVVDTMYQTGLRLMRQGEIAMIKETRRSRVLRPPISGPVFGLGIFWEIRYVEDIVIT